MYGYLLGILFSTVITVIAAYCIICYIAIKTVNAFMTLGSSGRTSYFAPLLVIGGYLSMAVAVALFLRHLFNINPVIGSLLNVLPGVILISSVIILNRYQQFDHKRKIVNAALNAIEDAPNIHLGTPFVKKIQKPNGGVTLFLHIPVTVTKTIPAGSVLHLAPLRNSKKQVKYSSKPHCDSCYVVPVYGFHLVDREHTKSPLPPNVHGTHVDSGELQPGQCYYLLQEIHFGHSGCKISDYDDFDLGQINITLDMSRVEQMARR